MPSMTDGRVLMYTFVSVASVNMHIGASLCQPEQYVSLANCC